jgi:hypothetical protein
LYISFALYCQFIISVIDSKCLLVPDADLLNGLSHIHSPSLRDFTLTISYFADIPILKHLISRHIPNTSFEGSDYLVYLCQFEEGIYIYSFIYIPWIITFMGSIVRGTVVTTKLFTADGLTH